MSEHKSDNVIAGEAISIEDVAVHPVPGMAIPGEVRFSPDDSVITYLFSPDGSLARQLYAYNPKTGEERLVFPTIDDGKDVDDDLTLAEKLRRERRRQRELGVTEYQWAGDTNQLLIPFNGNIYVKQGLHGPPQQIVSRGASPVLDPRFSPDGEWVAFVRDAELHVVRSTGGEVRQLTHGAREAGKTHGLAEYIAQEEMGRHHGFWWSEDNRWLAFTEVDESHIPVYRIMHQGSDVVGENAQEDHHYPFAGRPNATVRLGVVSVLGGSPVWMELGEDQDIYLARVKWLPDGRLSAQRLNREQTELDLLLFDPETGHSECLLREKTEVWINLHDLFRPLEDGRFIWASERSGFQHLYLYTGEGKLIHPLTSGQWIVDGIVDVDQRQEIVYFTGTRNGPTERHLYAISLAGGSPRRITTSPGTHTVTIDHAKQRFIDVHHAIDKPPTVELCSLQDGSALNTVYDKEDARVGKLNLTPPELISLENRNGIVLHGALYRPEGSGPHPTVIWVYGGPHSQQVTNGWRMTVSMRAQYLRSLGFLVFILDNQGSAGRGVRFESPIKHNMGQVEVDDQVDGVRWLVKQGLADPSRVGVYGWSYGGYMALMCLAKAAETFKVAIAGAPVTHWDGYDTCYTERYMGTPQSNPQGYQESSVMFHVGKIRGKLLMVHGLVDENVHFRHTARLINALIRAGKSYDLLLFPDERHMPRRLADRVYMEQRICSFFERHL